MKTLKISIFILIILCIVWLIYSFKNKEEFNVKDINKLTIDELLADSKSPDLKYSDLKIINPRIMNLLKKESTRVGNKKDKYVNGVLPGWIGGFKESLPGNGNISNLDMLHNTTNHNKITRQLKILWPEFSWNTTGDWNNSNDNRVYQRFAKDMSRIGYDDTGKIYNVICPQFGSYTPIGTIVNEVQVTEVRGWIDEKALRNGKEDWMNGEIKVQARIWFEQSEVKHNKLLRKIMDLAHDMGFPFPTSKDNALIVKTKDAYTGNEFAKVKSGYAKKFSPPEFTKHESSDPELDKEMDCPGCTPAVGVCHLHVIIDDAISFGDSDKDIMNQFLLNLINISVHNMFLKGNVVSWNINVSSPESVDFKEWKHHNEFWQRSLGDIHSVSHSGQTFPKYKNGDIIPEGNITIEDVLFQIAKMEASKLI
tara:strand:- start:57 stop:1325 length:1269 start_codon:yes stop_codon:yes gene_type:complete